MLVALTFLSLIAPPQPNRDQRATRLSSLERQLNAISASFPGRLGYSLTLLKDGRHIDCRGDERFPTASTIKTAIALAAICEIEDGRLKWTDKRPVPPSYYREGSMWSSSFKDGTKLDVDGWVNLMITVSDNTATMVMREWLTPDVVNARMAKLGMPNTKILWNYFAPGSSDAKLRKQFGLGMTTPNEMAHLFEMLYRRKATSEAGCEKLMRILSHQYWDDWIGGSVPVDVKVASKSGAINRSRSDTAIVFSPTEPYVLTIYTDWQKDQRYTLDNVGDLTLIKIAGLVWNTLHPQRPYRAPKGYDKYGPTGGGVE